MFQTLVHPTDFDAPSKEAFRVARALARSLGARLVVFHVVPPPAIVGQDGRVILDPHNPEPIDLWLEYRKLQAGDEPKAPTRYAVVVGDRARAKHLLEEQIRELGEGVLVPEGDRGTGKLKTPDDAEIPVWLGLANEDGFPHRGTINFADNQVNSKTGTLKVRGVFPNKDETLSPGYFARVRVPISAPHKALLVTERALDTDQGQKVVCVVDQDNRVASRPVRLGALHDGLREITDGLNAGERVIVNGLQQVRPGLIVEAKRVDMPSSEIRSQKRQAARR